MQVEFIFESDQDRKVVTEWAYSFHVDRKKVDVRMSASAQEGFTPFVEMEIIISNLRICKFYFSEIPGIALVGRYVALVFEWHQDENLKMPI
jgi:hypothetical protein